MSNHNSIQQALHIFHYVMQKRMTEPNNWIVLNRTNCLDFYCKGIIYIEDRKVLKQYFPNAELCFSAWNNGLRLKNIIHIIGKGRRHKCPFCTQTFYVDAVDEYRVHILHKHIAKGKYGRLTPQLSIRKQIVIQNNRTEIIIE